MSWNMMTESDRNVVDRAVRSTDRRTVTWLEFRMRLAAMRMVELASRVEEPGAPSPAEVRAALVAIADELARDSGITLDAILGREG